MSNKIWTRLEMDASFNGTLVKMSFGSNLNNPSYAVITDYRDAMEYARKVFRAAVHAKALAGDTSTTLRLSGRLTDANEWEHEMQKRRNASIALLPASARRNRDG